MYGVETLCVLIVCGGVVAILCVLWWWWCSNVCVSVVVLVQVLAGLETNTASILCVVNIEGLDTVGNPQRGYARSFGNAQQVFKLSRGTCTGVMPGGTCTGVMPASFLSWSLFQTPPLSKEWI